MASLVMGMSNIEDYIVVIYNLVTTKKYGFMQILLFVVYNRKGEI